MGRTAWKARGKSEDNFGALFVAQIAVAASLYADFRSDMQEEGKQFNEVLSPWDRAHLEDKYAALDGAAGGLENILLSFGQFQ